MLKKDFFTETIDQLSKELLYLVFYFQGEPYLNPDFLDMVKYASSKKIYTATSTNAHYLDDENAKRTIENGLDRYGDPTHLVFAVLPKHLSLEMYTNSY